MSYANTLDAELRIPPKPLRIDLRPWHRPGWARPAGQVRLLLQGMSLRAAAALACSWAVAELALALGGN